jgi:hypothetical protein
VTPLNFIPYETNLRNEGIGERKLSILRVLQSEIHAYSAPARRAPLSDRPAGASRRLVHLPRPWQRQAAKPTATGGPAQRGRPRSERLNRPATLLLLCRRHLFLIGAAGASAPALAGARGLVMFVCRVINQSMARQVARPLFLTPTHHDMRAAPRACRHARTAGRMRCFVRLWRTGATSYDAMVQKDLPSGALLAGRLRQHGAGRWRK